MNIAIICNHSKPDAKAITQNVVQKLIEFGANLFTAQADTAAEFTVKQIDESALFQTVELLVVVGGDGTIIHTAKKAAIYNLPVLGINAGRIGYLAGLESNQLDLLKRLVSGDFSVEKRMMLSVKTDGYSGLCLNDMVLNKSGINGMLDISVQFGEDTLLYRADGLIAATPTGSTAYSLSNGGPIVDPDLDCIILNPICPQLLSSRPILINSNNRCTVSVTESTAKKIELSIDGEDSITVLPKQEISVEKCKDYAVQLIKLNEHIFFDSLSYKFHLLK